jgi:hypothetical protein
MPGHINRGYFSVPSVGKGIAAVRGFNDGNSPVFPERNLKIAGVTKDSTGAPMGNCVLLLFDKADPGTKFGPFYSDAAGNYSIDIPCGLSQPQVTTWQVNAYMAMAPDVAGTTLNTLTGA